MKKRYAIRFTGVFMYGYYINSFKTWKPKEIVWDSEEELKKAATRFRFKFIAKAICWILNKSDAGILRTFKVVEI